MGRLNQQKGVITAAQKKRILERVDCIMEKVELISADLKSIKEEMALVSGKKYLSDMSIAEPRAVSNVNQKARDEKKKIVKFYVKEEAASEETITSSWDIYYRMRDLAKADQESFWVLGFDKGMKEICRECLFIGGLDHCNSDFRIIFKRLFAVGASSFVMVHNHPSGNTMPSKNDKELTDKLKKAADLMELCFLDHIIIGDWRYYSFKDDSAI